MKKWICKNESCGKNCTLSVDYRPVQCPRGLVWVAKWQEMGETVAESNQLPKLTAEVFDRPDCPEWAQWAAVDMDGIACYFSDKPTILPNENFWARWNQNALVSLRERYDASDWQNYLVERPAKLPEWVEIGGYVYDARNGYGKIVSGSVKSCYIEFDGGAGDFVPEAFAELKQARLRPYTPEEMKALVGKVIEFDVFAQLVLMYDGKDNAILAGDGDWISESTLLKDYTLDGSPCGVLEHLEDGEWVE